MAFLSDDFEWGVDGDPVHDSGGGVTWTTGGTPPTISTEQAHSGTRSAKWTGSAAQYMQTTLTAGTGYVISIWYWKETGGGTVRPIQHGDATHRFRIFVMGNGRICQYSDAGIRYYSFWPLDDWVCMEVRNLNWVAATFDIYANNTLVAAVCPMEASAAALNIYQATTEDTTSGKRFYLDDFATLPRKSAFGVYASRLVSSGML